MNFNNKKKNKIKNKIKNIDKLNIHSLYKLEYNILYQLNNKRYKDKLYLKNYLIKINNIKESYNKNTLENKLIYLKEEYISLKKQTNINNFRKKSKKLQSLIINSLKNSNNKYLILKYNNLEKKYKYIKKTITKSNKIYINKKSLSIKNKIKIYEFKIEKAIEKKFILDNYIFCLENILSDIKEEKMLEAITK